MKNSIIAIILIQIINLICQEINTLLKGYYLYKDEQLIQKNIKAEIYRKIAAVDLLKYEDTEFYNNYSRVIKQMGGSRIFETLDIFIDYFGKLVFSISFMTIIFTIDIYLLCFSLLFVIIGLFNSVKSSNISYKMYIETTNTDREEKYIDKLFYQKNFAEEIRFFNLAEWLLEKFNAIFVKRYMLIMKYKKKATILYAVSMIIETVIRIFL
ncbi:hypothetical protein, partial [Methanoculleus sp.]|uniref:hypothetical protein n=1 Tax=Methanoculleus sp. TaxID=90427 RepID=UPI0025EE00CD